MSAFEETTLAMPDGRELKFITSPLAFDAAFDLQLELMEVIAKPLGDAAGELFKGGQAESFLDVEGLDNIDAHLGNIVSSLPRLIAQKGGSKLVARILGSTSVVLQGEGGRPRKSPLSDAGTRSIVFSGANFAWIYRVIAWVLAVNYAPFGTGNTSDWSGLWQQVKGWLPILRAETDLESNAEQSRAQSE